LININKFDAHNIPLGFLTKHFVHRNIKLISLKNVVLGVLKEDEALYKKIHLELNYKEKKFSFDQSTLISLEEICYSHIKPKTEQLNGSISLKYQPRDKYKLYYKIEDSFIRVGISVTFDWEVKNTQIPIPILTYDKDLMGLSIWNLEGSSKNTENWTPQIISVTKFGETTALGIL
jgi:hypothetical protein